MTFRNDMTNPGRARRAGGGRVVAGGGIGTLVVLVLFLLFDVDPSVLELSPGNAPASQQQSPYGSGNGNGTGTDATGSNECRTGADANANLDCRIEFTGLSLDEVWSQVLPAQAGIRYTEPGLTLFHNSVSTACGQASSATGPFYCPGDQTAYFDTSFFQMLEKLGGANAPFAQEYVVAHEFGHHIQTLEGTIGRSDYNNPGEDSAAVKSELQADCYAGIWAHYADKGPNAYLEPISQSQLRSAIDTARAIGDDNIQRRSGGSVNPDAFTHGSSAQRVDAFMAGYQSGLMSSCDTWRKGGYRN